MKFTWGPSDASDFVIRAHDPGRWEGTPRTGCYRLQQTPQGLSADRIAVAATLLYAPYLNGVLQFGCDINIVTASAIRDFLSPAEIFIERVDEGPKPIESGDGCLVVASNRLDLMAVDSVDLVDRLYVDLPAHQYTGSLGTHRGRAVASNGYLFENTSGYGAFAGAVLLSAGLEAGRLRADASVLVRESSRLSRLLSSVGLGLEL